jgi:ssDNA-binding Zn-finger/Zn-ribbon topoisomerase 1
MPEHIVKACPKCGQPLLIRHNHESGQEFLGCSSWPECKHTEALPEHILLRRAGQQGLFDEEEPS